MLSNFSPKPHLGRGWFGTRLPRFFFSSSTSGQSREQLKKDFDYCVELVQQRDRESYLCGLLMPSSSRRSYFAVRAFNVELASIKDGGVGRRLGGNQFDAAGSSVALKIRSQWWREALDRIYGEDTAQEHEKDEVLKSMAISYWRNPIVRVLNRAVHESNLTRRFLERLIEAREESLDERQVETVDGAVLYAENIFSSLFYLSLETAGVSDQDVSVMRKRKKISSNSMSHSFLGS